ncbi:helix-turn-helix domain-containing protein [Micromonospora cathayae]|uniref:Helix-turn-helix transcriptional regulator n=1 Tax=Micromonospora cathayae TaxID=3028804 RepID=A0ABY7ZT66_9ACTN|nr:helix-turn-helix transcriptional regulator [Micromonospora sp. HUAS 3]WDZ85996.1 helix-turn-helix transcriptional regulator [Micromonospora sp. HUAS 3]
MRNEQAVTLRAQWIGQQLRDMRERARLTLKDVGDYLNRNASTVSRMESGIVPPRVPEVLAYLDLCGVDDPRRREDLKTMAQDAWQKGWWDGFSANVAGSLIDWIWLESRATEIRSFQLVVVPGLLQIRSYAEALIRAWDESAADEQVSRFVDVRMKRQRRLEEGEPVYFSAVIDEGALRRTVGGPEVMRQQLAHLRMLAGWPNVEIMILPAQAGAHASPDGGFDVFRMRRPYPPTGCIGTAAGTIVVEGTTAESLMQRYDRLRRVALRNGAVQRFLFDLEARLE